MVLGRAILQAPTITEFCSIIKMKVTNPIPKKTRDEFIELLALRKALVKKGVVTDAEIKAEKNK